MKATPYMVEQLIEKYGALQNAREVVCLIDYLQRIEQDGYALSEPPSLFIEIGVWKGGNAAILKTFFPDVRYIGVDVIAPETATVAEFGLEIVQGESGPETVDRVRAMIGDRQADFLFIDAAHDYDSVKRDYQVWSPLAARVGFHDVHNPMVYQFWQEVTGFMQPGPRTAALWKEMDGHGIGVVYV